MMSPKRLRADCTKTTTRKPATPGRACRWWFGFLWLALLLATTCTLSAEAASTDTAQRQAVEQRKIDFLIDSVATLKDARFMRNGTSHDADQAAFHMRMKLRLAGSRVKTAEDFIRYCGSKSSRSGAPYRIRFADGHSIDAETFLRRRLADYPAGFAPHLDLGH